MNRPNFRLPVLSSRRAALGLRVPSSLTNIEGRRGAQGRRHDIFHLLLIRLTGNALLNVELFTIDATVVDFKAVVDGPNGVNIFTHQQ